ncbi:MAG: Ku protein [Candidatus Sumerlaeota bacterium]
MPAEKRDPIMTARTMWKGRILIQDREVPVRLYSAAKDHTVHFRLLHKKDMTPVRQRMIHPETGKQIDKDTKQKGAEVNSGVFVILDEDDMEEVEPDPSREIEVLRFVPRKALEQEWYNRPYYLGPDTDPDSYWGLVSALEDSDREGIVRWVMRKKEYIGSVFAHQGYLALSTLRFSGEVVQPEELDLSQEKDVSDKELAMAEQLTDIMRGEGDISQYRDEYHDQVLEMIKAKSEGEKIPKRKTKKKKTKSLTDALKQSLAQKRG